jgi:hypothetical protein
MKKPISWHEENIKNQERDLKSQMTEFINFQKRLEEAYTRNLFYKSQVAKAKSEGLTEFDNGRYMVKKKRSEKGGSNAC